MARRPAALACLPTDAFAESFEALIDSQSHYLDASRYASLDWVWAALKNAIWAHFTHVGHAIARRRAHRSVLQTVWDTAAAASACGGFFCSQVQMDQAGEHILFAVEGEDVTGHIKIDYEGAPTNFSWVLPVPNLPEISVGSNLLFDRLRAMTDPSFRITWDNPEGCNYANSCSCQLAAATGGTDGGDGTRSPAPVEILAEGEVGAFTFKVVSSEEGDIQPLVLKYTAPSLACVPLKLTSIAESPDMPVFTWVLARARAIPLNFFHVLLNAKPYDWMNCATEAGDEFDWCGSFNNSAVDCDQHYLDLVTQAANAANGHAFVTEFAGATTIMDNQLYTEGQFDLEALKTKATPGSYLLALLSQGFQRDALMQEVIKTVIPKPE